MISACRQIVLALVKPYTHPALPQIWNGTLQSLPFLWILSTSVCSGCCVPFIFPEGCWEGWSCLKYLPKKMRERQEQSKCEEGGFPLCWKSSRLTVVIVNSALLGEKGWRLCWVQWRHGIAAQRSTLWGLFHICLFTWMLS